MEGLNGLHSTRTTLFVTPHPLQSVADPSLWARLRTGLAATRPYLLSHHEPGDYDRCYTVWASRNVRLCARCSGIYPGIVLGLLAAWAGAVPSPAVVVVALLPLPALVDWAVTAFGAARGANIVRTTTGALLGFGYAVGVVRVLFARDLGVVTVGLCYGVVAAALLGLERRHESVADSR